MKAKFLLFTAICMSIFTFSMFDVSAETYGDLTYEISDGEITITDCNGMPPM